MASGCDSNGLLSDGTRTGQTFIRWLFEYASDANLCSLALNRFVAVARPLIKVLDFHQALSCNSNDFHILGNPTLV